MNLKTCLFCCGDLFFHDNCKFIYILKKKNCFIFWSNTYQSFSTMCYFVFSSFFASAFDLLKHVYLYTYCTYVHQRIDLRFCCDSVYVYFQCILYVLQMFLPHFIFIMIQAPSPPGHFTQTHITKLNCFQSIKGAYLPQLQLLILPVSQYVCASINIMIISIIIIINMNKVF